MVVPRLTTHVNSEQTKATAYCSMVRPLLENCSIVWSPNTHEYVHKLEMVQRRAARYVTNRYHNTSSVTSILDHLDWESLEARGTKHRLIMFFKIVNGHVDIPSDAYLTPASTRTRSTTHVNSEQTKATAYYSMVRPLLENCSIVWSPNTHEYVHKLEMVQRIAARYVTNRYHNTSSVTSILDHLDLESLGARGTKHRLIMFFKIVNGHVDIPSDAYLTPASTRNGPITY